MAKLADIEIICSELGLSFSDMQMKSIAARCGQIDPKAVILDLGVKDKISAQNVLKACQKRQQAQKRTFCGFCHDTWLSILDVKAYDLENCPPITTICAMQTTIPCPNCQKPEKTNTILASMTSREQGWAWVFLYRFIHDMNPTVTPDEFDPNEFWPHMEISPELTDAHRQLLNWIQRPYTIPMPRPVNQHPSAINGAKIIKLILKEDQWNQEP